MPLGAMLGAGAVMGGLEAFGAMDAAKTEASAARAATAAQMAMFEQAKKGLQPYMDAGTMSLSALNSYLGLGPNGLSPNSPLTKPFTASMMQNMPGYQWQLGQGEQAIMQGAAATGGLDSGNTLKSLNNYAQGLASTNYQQQYQDYLQQLQLPIQVLGGIAGQGQGAATSLAGVGTNYAGMIGNNITGAGNALAAGKVGATNALTGAVGGGMNQYLQWMMMQQGAGANPAAAGITNLGYTPPAAASSPALWGA